MTQQKVNKDKWYAGEQLVCEYYTSKGYRLLEKNFTIRGGEIDIIVENKDTCVFVEVKVVDQVDDLFSYISPHKLQTLKRTIQDYVFKHPTNKEMRVDIAFVKENTIFEIYENVTNS